MNIKDLIILGDVYAPGAYADMIEMPWGVIFYDESCPTKHDSNHACILNDNLFCKAIADIKEFYLNKNIEPRIYLFTHQKEAFAGELKYNGFNIYECGDFKHFLLMNDNEISPMKRLDIRELTSPDEITPKLLHNLYDVYMKEDPEEINCMSAVLPRCVNSSKCRVFVGYLENEPVCMAMIVKTGFGLQCFDLVETASKFQRNGYARELISYLVKLCDKATYLYSENPTAIRIYEEAGFEEIDIPDKSIYWRAVCNENNIKR